MSPESEAVGYCCFIVVMPAEATVSAGFFSPLRSRASTSPVVAPPNSRMSPGHWGGAWGGGGWTWQFSLHWNGSDWGSHRFEFGRVCPGAVLSTGLNSAGGSPRVSSICIGINGSISPLPHRRRLVYRERWQTSRLFLYYFVSFIFFFLHICILCIIAFCASSFYSFLYQKCTTLYDILNNYDEGFFFFLVFCFLFCFFTRESFVWWRQKEKLWEDWKAALFFMCFCRMVCSFPRAHVAIAFIFVVQPPNLFVRSTASVCCK